MADAPQQKERSDKGVHQANDGENGAHRPKDN